MTERIGYTVNTTECSSTNSTAFAILVAEDAQYEQPGTVVEIDMSTAEDSSIESKRFGIVVKARRNSDIELLEAELNEDVDGPEPTTQTVLELTTIAPDNMNATIAQGATVRPASAEGICEALAIPDDGLPVGVYTLPSGNSPVTPPAVHLNPDYLLGDQAAHNLFGGMSGFGKTSFALVTTKSVLSHDDVGEKTAIVAFNVKQDDLLWLDRPNPNLDAGDEKIFDKMDVPAEPFTNVSVYAPEHGDRPGQPNSVRLDAIPFTYEWGDLSSRDRELLFPTDTVNQNLRNLLVDKALDRAQTFDEVLRIVDRDDDSMRLQENHAPATIKKAHRNLRSLTYQLEGLLGGESDALTADDLLEPGKVNVIDINESRLSVTGQRMVFSQIRQRVSEAIEQAASGADNIENIVFFADELNRFAPKSVGRESALAEIREGLTSTAQRGRSSGEIIFGMAQRLSKIAEDIRTETATEACVRMDSLELDNTNYRWMEQETKEIIQGFDEEQKGIAYLRHVSHREPFFIQFPRPPCAQEIPPEYDVMSKIVNNSDTFEEEYGRAHLFRRYLDEDDSIDADDIVATLRDRIGSKQLDRLYTSLHE